MIIQIETKGGFAGIAVPSPPRRIEIPDAPASGDMASLHAAFQPDRLSRMAAKTCRTCPDQISYRITVTGADRQIHCFTLSETQLPPEMLDMIDRI